PVPLDSIPRAGERGRLRGYCGPWRRELQPPSDFDLRVSGCGPGPCRARTRSVHSSHTPPAFNARSPLVERYLTVRRRDAVRGGWMSMLQVVVSGLLLLLLYSFVVRALGEAAFGVWALVLATVSAGRLGDLGMSRAVVRFVAQRRGRGDEKEAALIVETAALTLGGVGAVLLPILYVPCAWSLGAVVSGPSLSQAIALLPYALASVWLLAIGGAFQSALDGCQRLDVRNAIGIGSNILHLALALVLVPHYGLVGLAYAQVLQCSALVVGSWIALRRQLRALPMVPCNWKRPLAGEMLTYSINLQIGSAAQLLFEPVSKMLMARFGGLEAVGYFEMANRLVLQVRRLPLSAAEVLVPVVAHFETRPGNRVGAICREAFGLLAYCAVPLYGIVIAMAPVVSTMWLGRREPVF